jgi:hypothetical protein
LKNDKLLAELKCWYDTRHQFYFLLMPIKIEQHSFEPAIYTFHDVLSDEEIETIKELAKPLVTLNLKKKYRFVLKTYASGVNAVGSIDGARETWRGARSFKC